MSFTIRASKDSPKACDAPASTNMSKCNVSVYLDPNNLRAAEVYKGVEDVKSIVMLLDGRMDGCKFEKHLSPYACE